MPSESVIRLGLPKGRMQEGVFALMADAGLPLKVGARGYRPTVGLPGFEAKIQKPQNIIEMLHAGTRDVGFAGADWVAELDAQVVELLDTAMDPVRLVAAAPESILVDGKLPHRSLVVASEYEGLTTKWIADRGLDAKFVRTYGATEVFPPEDADCIVDITQTGATLKANGLAIVEDIDRSSTRLYMSQAAAADPEKRERLDAFATLLGGVLEARRRAMLEVNVSKDGLDALVDVLPAMREPTVSALRSGGGYAVKVAVLREEVPSLIPKIQAVGGTDIVVSRVTQIVK